jgi:hypothetical protein
LTSQDKGKGPAGVFTAGSWQVILTNIGWWRRLWGSVVVIALVMLFTTVSHSAESEREALCGLKGLYVVVENVQPQVERLGLSKNEILKDVELRLQTAGVKIMAKNVEKYSKKDIYETPGMSTLYINVNTSPTLDLPPRLAFSIRVELKEIVTVARGFFAVGVIWDTSALGVVETNNINKIQKQVDDLVTKFIDDYLAVNPK